MRVEQKSNLLPFSPTLHNNERPVLGFSDFCSLIFSISCYLPIATRVWSWRRKTLPLNPPTPLPFIVCMIFLFFKLFSTQFFRFNPCFFFRATFTPLSGSLIFHPAFCVAPASTWRLCLPFLGWWVLNHSPSAPCLKEPSWIDTFPPFSAL